MFCFCKTLSFLIKNVFCFEGVNFYVCIALLGHEIMQFTDDDSSIGKHGSYLSIELQCTKLDIGACIILCRYIIADNKLFDKDGAIIVVGDGGVVCHKKNYWVATRRIPKCGIKPWPIAYNMALGGGRCVLQR